MSRSLLANLDKLNRRDVAGEVAVPGAGLPSPVHVQTVAVMHDLMSLGRTLSGGSTPPVLRALMRTLDKSQSILLESIANVPPADIKRFMADLGARIQTIVDTDA